MPCQDENEIRQIDDSAVCPSKYLKKLSLDVAAIKSYIQRPHSWRYFRDIRTVNTPLLITREQEYGSQGLYAYNEVLSTHLNAHQPSYPSAIMPITIWSVFSCKSDSTITNVCSSVRPSVTKTPQQLEIIHPSSLIILHSSFLHLATFKLFSLFFHETRKTMQ